MSNRWQVRSISYFKLLTSTGSAFPFKKHSKRRRSTFRQSQNKSRMNEMVQVPVMGEYGKMSFLLVTGV